MAPKKYTLSEMRDTYAYVRLFGCNPRKYQSPLEANNNPETLRCEDVKISRYSSHSLGKGKHSG